MASIPQPCAFLIKRRRSNGGPPAPGRERSSNISNTFAHRTLAWPVKYSQNYEDRNVPLERRLNR